MANNINWGKIYETTYWGIGVSTNTISWGKVYEDLMSGASFSLDFDKIATDFTFTRSSFATRVNEFGLIETVTNLGSDLVQNGSFDELGSEQVVNGDFATDSDWTLVDNSTISDGKANAVSNSNGFFIIQTSTLDTNKTYKLTFDLTDYTSGTLQFATADGDISFSNTLGTKELTFNPLSANILFKCGNSPTTLSIDNVSVKQVDPNDDWSVGSDSEINNGSARIYSPSGGYTFVSQSSVLTIGKTYLISLEIVEQNAGEIRLSDGSGYLSPSFSGVGLHTFTSASLGTILRIQRTTSITDIRIDNVSVQEVIEDDIPRIDYTTGEAAFLLEPQSTNLITNSENFNGSANAVVTSDSETSPRGLVDASEVTFDGTAFGRVEKFVSTTIGETYTFSVYLKNKNLNDVTQVWLGFSQAAQGGFVTITNEWQRYEISAVADGSTEYPRVQYSDTGSMYVWGMQTEELSYATSYIPTEGSTVTRSAESCVDATPTINSEEGVLYAEISALDDDSSLKNIELNDGTASNRVFIYYRDSTLRCFFVVNGVTVFSKNQTISDVTELHKCAIKWKENDFSFYIDGVSVHSQLSGNTFTANTLTDLDFSAWTGGINFYGNTKDLKIYDKALTDEELTELTTI